MATCSATKRMRISRNSCRVKAAGSSSIVKLQETPLASRMFATPNRVRQGSASTTLERTNATRSQARDNAGSDEEEHPIENGEVGSNGEVMTMLRSLVQQVSTLQAQQEATRAQAEASPRANGSTAASTPTPAKRRLPRELVVSLVMFYVLCDCLVIHLQSIVHQTIKTFRDRIDDPLEWNTAIWYEGITV